ncbi:glycosyltransferase [bacterium]|nr:glycosyltransferase [bacterium]
MKQNITIGSFPYAPGFNPYQKLFTGGIEEAGLKVLRIPPKKWFPLQKAVASDCDLLHLDWPQDWYTGRGRVSKALKGGMYRHGLSCLRKKPTVWTAHNLISHDSLDPTRDKKMNQALIDVCRGVMVMSDAAELQLRELYRIPGSTNVRKVPHGHYIDCYLNVVSRDDARKRFSLAREKFIYLMPGAVKPYKGHADAIRSFVRCSAKDDVLIVAGRGEDGYIEQLRAIESEAGCVCSGDIQFIDGQISDNDFQYLFNLADVTVLPFVNVLNSGSLLLAMSFGSPVIAPRIGSIPEIALPEFFFGYDSNESVDDSLERAMRNAKCKLSQEFTKHKIQEVIISYTKEEYDWGDAGASLAEWYSEILEKC